MGLSTDTILKLPIKTLRAILRDPFRPLGERRAACEEIKRRKEMLLATDHIPGICLPEPSSQTEGGAEQAPGIGPSSDPWTSAFRRPSPASTELWKAGKKAIREQRREARLERTQSNRSAFQSFVEHKLERQAEARARAKANPKRGFFAWLFGKKPKGEPPPHASLKSKITSVPLRKKVVPPILKSKVTLVPLRKKVMPSAPLKSRVTSVPLRKKTAPPKK